MLARIHSLIGELEQEQRNAAACPATADELAAANAELQRRLSAATERIAQLMSSGGGDAAVVEEEGSPRTPRPSAWTPARREAA
jgi:hypothetical protein